MSYQQNVLIAYKENVTGNVDNNFSKVYNYLKEDNHNTSTLINNPLPTPGNAVGNLCDNVTTFYRNRQAFFMEYVDGENVGNVESHTLSLVNANQSITDNKMYLVDANTVAYSTQYLKVESTNELTQYDNTNDEDSEYKLLFTNTDNSFKQRTVNHYRNTDNNENMMRVGYDNDFNNDSLFAEKQLVLSDADKNQYSWQDLDAENKLSTYYDVNYENNEDDSNVKYGVYKVTQSQAEQQITVNINKNDGSNDLSLANNDVPFYTSGDYNVIQGGYTHPYFYGVEGEYLNVNKNYIALEFCIYANVENDGNYTLNGQEKDNNFEFDYSTLKNSNLYFESGSVNSNIDIVVNSAEFTKTSSDSLEFMQLIDTSNETISDSSKIDNTFEVEVDSSSQARVEFLDSESNTLDNNYLQTFDQYNNLDLTLNNSLTARIYYENDSDVQNNFYLQGTDLTTENPKHYFTYVAAETTEPTRDDSNRLPSFRHLNNDHELHYNIDKNNTLTFTSNSSNLDAFVVDIKTTVYLANERRLYDENGNVVGIPHIELYNSGNSLINGGLDSDLLLATVIGNNLDNSADYKDNRVKFTTISFEQFKDSINIPSNISLSLNNTSEICYTSTDIPYIEWDKFEEVYGTRSLLGTTAKIFYKQYWTMANENEHVLFDGRPNKIEVQHEYDRNILNAGDDNILIIPQSDIQAYATEIDPNLIISNIVSTRSVNNNLTGIIRSSLYDDARLVSYTRTFNRYVSYNSNLPGLKGVNMFTYNLRDIITTYRIEYRVASSGQWVQQSASTLTLWKLDGKSIKHYRVLSIEETSDDLETFANKDVPNENFQILIGDGSQEMISTHEFSLDYTENSFATMTVVRQYKDNTNNWIDIVTPTQYIDYRQYGAQYNFEMNKLSVSFYSGQDLLLEGNKNYFVDLTLEDGLEDSIFTTVKLYDFTNNLDKYPRDFYNADLESLDVPSRDLNIDLQIGADTLPQYNSNQHRSLTFVLTDPNEEFDAIIVSEIYFLTNMRINYLVRPIVKWNNVYRLLYKNTDSFEDKNMTTSGINLYYNVNQDYFDTFNNNNQLSSQDFVLQLVPDYIRVKYYDNNYSTQNLSPINKLTYDDNNETHYITLDYYRGYQTKHVIYERSTTTITVSVFGTVDETTYTQIYNDVYNGKVLVFNNLENDDGKVIDLGLELTSLFSKLRNGGNTQYTITLTPSTVTYNVVNPNSSLSNFVPNMSEYVTNLREFNTNAEGDSYTITKSLRLLPRRAVSFDRYSISWCYIDAELYVYFSPFGESLINNNTEKYSADVFNRSYQLESIIYPRELLPQVGGGVVVNNTFKIIKNLEKNNADQNAIWFITCAPAQFYIDMVKYNSEIPSDSTNTVRYYNFVRKSYVYNHQTFNVGNNNFFGVNSRGNGVDQTAEELIQFTKLGFDQNGRYLRANNKNEERVNMLENKVVVTEYANNNYQNGVVVFSGYLDRQFNPEDESHPTTTEFMDPSYPLIRNVNFDYVLRFKQILSEVVSLDGLSGGSVGITNNNDIYNIELLFNNAFVPSGSYEFDLAPEKSVQPYFYYKQFGNYYRVTCNDFDVETALPMNNSCGYLRFVVKNIEKLVNPSSSSSGWVLVDENDIIYSLYNPTQLHLQVQFNYNDNASRNRLLSVLLPTQGTNKLLLLDAKDIMKWCDAAGNEIYVVSYAGHVHTQYTHNVATKFYSLTPNSKYTEGVACENILTNMPSYVIEQ